MSINILDDEVLKRNQQLISSIEDNKTSIETEEENKKTQFAVLYDGDPRKALEDARRNVEIDINSAGNRTPAENTQNDTRVDEITYKGFDKGEGSAKWNKISEENEGTTKTISDSKFRERQNLENAKEIIKGESNLTYNKVYQNSFWSNNDWFGNRARLPENPISQETVNISNLEVRGKAAGGFPVNEDRLRELSIFVFMLFPYIGTNVALTARSGIEEPNIAGLATSASANVFFAFNNLRYFTGAELISYFGHNFYTLNFLKGHSIKYPLSKLWNQNDVGVREWDGRPDIFFGEESQVISGLKALRNLLRRRPTQNNNDGSQALTKLKDGPQQSQGNETNSTNPLSPQIFISGGRARAILVDEPTALLTEGVKSSQRDKEGTGGINPRTGSLFGVISFVPIVSSVNGKWQLEPSIQRGIFSKDVLESKPQSQELNSLYVNEDVFNITKYTYTPNEEGRWNSIPDSIPDTEIQTFERTDVLNRNNETEERNYILNEDVLNIRLDNFQYPDDEIPEEQETIRRAIERRNKERDNINQLQVGSILVAPVVDDDFRNELPRFYIPFQFNPNISEAGAEAQYESTNVLSRIGEIFSFTNVSSLTITLETEYIATSDREDNEVATDGNNWMNFYTLEKLQAIEKAYRSLVLPHYPETNIEEGYIYVKPPLLRVIMGGSNDDFGDSGPYANILTYGRNSMTTNIAESSGTLFASNTRLKNFIATNVTIKKDLNENPIVLDNKGRILDAMRFSVSLNLTEVSANYLDSLPDFKRYSDEYIRRMPTVGVSGDLEV